MSKFYFCKNEPLYLEKMKQIHIILIGYKFMGRAHSNAWIKAPLVF